jgi:ligand-binding sensor domain-containing protein
MKNVILCLAFIAANQLLAQSFQKFVYNTSNSGLPDNLVRSISIDSNDVVWAGTANGLARFDGTNWTVWNTANSSLPGNNIRLVQTLPNGEVWFNSPVPGPPGPYKISKLYGNNLMSWTDITSNAYDYVDAFDYYDNKVWVSTNSGLYTYKNNIFSKYNTPSNCIPPTAVSDILFITPDKYWIGLSDYTLNGSASDGLLRIEQGICTHYNHSNSGFPSENVTLDLRKDKDNPDKVWMRANAGIVSFDGSNWEVLTPPWGAGPSSYAIDSFGIIWAGYDFHGLQMYDGAWNSFQTFVNDGVNAVAIDSHNNIWVGTQSSGLIKLKRGVTSTSGISSAPSVKCYPTIFRQELSLEQHEDRALSFQLMDINSKIIVKELFAGRKASIALDGYKIPTGIYFYCIKNENNEIIRTGKLLKAE